MTKLVVEKESAPANAAALQRLQLIITIRFVLKYGCLIGESRARPDKGLFFPTCPLKCELNIYTKILFNT